MSKPYFKSSRWFKADPITFKSGKVNFETGVIKDVILCQVGEAKGHGLFLEQEFITSLQAYAVNHHKIGMKCRFGHPSMSNEALGTQMGRFHNFQVDGPRIKADLHLFESANLSPNNPGMKDWMLSMAEEDSDAIMCSIVFIPKSFYQYDAKQKQQEVIWSYEFLKWIPKGKNAQLVKGAKTYPKLQSFTHTDIVDQGAATDKLFSAEFNKDKFSVIATEFLNEHPDLDAFFQSNPDKIKEFFGKRFSNDSNLPKESNSTNTNMKIDMSKYPTFASLLSFTEAESSAEGLHLQDSHLETLEKSLATGAESAKQVGTLTTDLEGVRTELSGEKTKVTGLETEVADFKANYVPAPGQAANADDTKGESAEGDFYSETDKQMAELREVNN